MAEKFLIDTSAVIKYLNETLSSEGLDLMDLILNTESNISFISEIELQAWNPTDPSDLNIYKLFITGSNVIGIDSNIIQKTTEIRKNYKLKLPDALIAATALVTDMTLVADNNVDFKRVLDLKYINPMQVVK